MPDRVARFLLLAACLTIPFTLWALLSTSAGSGSLYPEFSSLRSDANGALVLYDSLAQTGYFQVVRNFRPISQTHWKGATVLALGIPLRANADETARLFADCEALARLGNRMVVILQPSIVGSTALANYDWSPFEKRDLHLTWTKRNQKPTIWQAAFQPGKSWRVLRTENGSDRAIERAVGPGTLVLALSSDRFTNVGMLKQRDASLMLTLLGAARQVVFDESHLGIAETGTVLGLARRYRLQGFLIGVLVLAALYLWRSSSAFPPQPEAEKAVPERLDPIAALSRLLERSLPETQLIEECRRARAQVDRGVSKNSALASVIAEQASERNPVRLFENLQGVLASGRPKNSLTP
jgi:hypothetical protein